MAQSADYGLGEFPFPRGWFAVANGSEIGGTPTTARYFGAEVVIFRGEDGQAVMLEAYCPHMGTHLGRSRSSYIVASGQHVEAGGIRCPFHGWRFGPDGRCNDIPYFDGPIPERARLRSWPVQERYGLVFCWNDPEGQGPDFDLPEFPEWDDPQWMRWPGLEHLGDLPCHPIEIFDNNSDWAHLMYTHGGVVRFYENEVDGHCYRQRESMVGHAQGIGDSFGAERLLSTVNSYVGPGLNAARFLEANAAQLIAVTPIEDGSARLWQCAMIRRPDGTSDDQAQEALLNFNRNMAKGLGHDDGEIWAHKRAAIQILQLPTDGPFRQARTWYSQFFNPRSKAAEILERVEGLHYVRGVPAFSEMAAE
ncbi:Rieske 2Fe-2S domain-containing protein [Phenylobacterium sp. LjRoot225]|uniref:Rieske 2Fe-2S domain-containing protein n=1 Tax=Phenylobacterium sp. LjRoot225 TaxID=3342285 RepID=UPI003ECEB765